MTTLSPPYRRIAVTHPAGIQALVAPEVSPDGKTIAYTTFVGGQGQVYVGATNGANAAPLLPGGENAWSSGGFSPDGQFVLVTDQQPPKMLKRVRLANGQATAIAEAGAPALRR